MSCHRTIIRLSAVLASLALGWACGGDSATAPEPARPTTVTVSPATHELTALGATVQLSAEVRDQNARVMAGATVTWTSSASSMATVNASGLVTAAGNGTATITASAGSASGSAVVTVMQSAASVEVSPSVYELTALGQTVQLTAEAFDENGHAVAGAEFSWESSDAAVATVDAGGLVTGVAEGVATITASAGEASGSAVVPVMQPVASVQVSPSAETIGLGSTLQLTAEAFDENGEAVAGVEFSWESSDAAVATVDAGGLVTGVAVGVATITASAGSAEGAAEVTVADLDRAALVALYEGTDGPHWVNAENWLTDAPLGEWYGVDTDNSGRVVRLDLDGRWDSDAREYIPHGLSGPVPPELGNLANLTRLDLGHNFLSGPVPTELGSLTDLELLHLAGNDLTGPIPTELGELASLTGLWLYSNSLTGPVPTELGSLADLESLHLGGNDLTGPIPTELGELASLTGLWLSYNDLTGPIPESFLELEALERFRFERNVDLCAPGTIDFVAWLEGIEDTSGPYCNESDVVVLNLLYETSGGPDWTNSTGWLETPALDEWYGVTADALGRVVTLDLTRNGLAGQLPGSLGELAYMTELRIADNTDLSGRLPLSLASLSLRAFHYAGTDLCAPVDTSFRNWLSTIPSHEGTGGECGPLSDREVLEALYDVTGGPNWGNRDNWRTDAPLGDWHGVQVDASGRVERLYLDENDLSGPIPPEIGELANLEWLYLDDNDLSGPIPPEIGELANLERLYLDDNDLSGPIPPEIGELANLERLYLDENDLSGPIPPEIGELANLEQLYLDQNDLSGPIPPEIGNLGNLASLRLGENDLSGRIPPEIGHFANLGWLELQHNGLEGPIPPELGRLTGLRSLALGHNQFTGSVPASLGALTRLQTLALSNNTAMSGALPSSLTNLRSLETLEASGTQLCAPSDPSFLRWLNRLAIPRVALCGNEEPASAYLVQAVQSRGFPVPLVAGEKALLRVFVTATRANQERLPPVRASFYRNGSLTHVADIAAKAGPIPMEVDEGSLEASANSVIPANVVRPGLEMVIEVDPEGTIDPALGVTRRIPETGGVAIEVQAMPLFDLTLIPFVSTERGDAAIVALIDLMAADPENHHMLGDARQLLPIAEWDVKAHEPVRTSRTDRSTLISETAMIRSIEGGTGYYMGMSSYTGGRAYVGGRVSISRPRRDTFGHELGHNLSLSHAPGCNAGGDPAFPHAGGLSGAWGYDFEGGGRLVRPSMPDLMTYCGPPDGVSDYHFTKALRFRLSDDGDASAAMSAAPATSLLLWGGADLVGVPHLEPAFVVDAPAALPDSAGAYRITGRTAAGNELFSFSFTMPEMADGDGSSSFAFVLPVRPDWPDNLASITLTGPGGSFTLDGASNLPMAILRNPRTGQIRGILRDLASATQVPADASGQAAGPGLEVLFSRGLPGGDAWRR